MIRRMLNYDKKDWNHVRFLFFNMIKQFFLLDFKESKEAWYFLKLHLTHDSNRVDK
ncbi:gp232 [Bacillus phage G]|uniref:Gp232 n=1 Tax=Bacillus phage G TaxID=2884420 RepID=G3M9X3_9CAUD|nr:gp232 [Bacillus phage G]AEO93491.1 gp232 [Bacillus phage G]